MNKRNRPVAITILELGFHYSWNMRRWRALIYKFLLCGLKILQLALKLVRGKEAIFLQFPKGGPLFC
jgi:hypothetical protein